jgi:hypothetical protein
MNTPSQQPQRTVEAQLIVIRTIWISMMVAICMFAFVAFTHQHPPLEGMDMMVNMMWAMAIVVAFIGKFLPKVIYEKSPNKIQALTTAHIIRYALFEAAALFCFMNVMVNGVPFERAAIGFVLVIALYLSHPPRAEL